MSNYAHDVKVFVQGKELVIICEEFTEGYESIDCIWTENTLLFDKKKIAEYTLNGDCDDDKIIKDVLNKFLQEVTIDDGDAPDTQVYFELNSEDDLKEFFSDFFDGLPCLGINGMSAFVVDEEEYPATIRVYGKNLWCKYDENEEVVFLLEEKPFYRFDEASFSYPKEKVSEFIEALMKEINKVEGQANEKTLG